MHSTDILKRTSNFYNRDLGHDNYKPSGSRRMNQMTSLNGRKKERLQLQYLFDRELTAAG